MSLLPLLRHLGPRWLAARAWMVAERKLGLLARRSPLAAWESFGPTDASAFAPVWRQRTPRLPIAQIDRTYLAPWLERWSLETGCSPVAEADGLARGQLRIFSGVVAPLGQPPKWHRNLLTGVQLSAVGHWLEQSDAGGDDIKGVWEASRFSWVFPLVRAWVLDGEARHVELFWKLVEDWLAKNPPNAGPNWMCGQEASLRLIAFAFGLQAFRDHSATTDAHLQLAARLADATGRRIESHFAYAVSQQNNHGISEAVGLYTIGLFWPQLPAAPRWRDRGLEALLPMVHTLVAADGGFSQHSTNYHRLFLQLMTWTELLLRSEGHTLPEQTRLRVIASVDFLASLVEADGTVARYGADDGAQLFPLSGCPFEDFRPTVAAATLLFKGERGPPGPWDETSLLLCGPLAPSVVTSTTPSIDAPTSGVSVLRHPRGMAFFRAPTEFRTRPSQADQLHVSLYWDGTWITEDTGSFSYNTPAAGGDRGEAVFHNVITVDGQGPMQRFSRFLWLPWTVCVRGSSAPDSISASHRGVAGFHIARRVLRFPQGFVIIDRVIGQRPSEIALRWHGRTRTGLEQLAVVCSEPSSEKWISADEQTGEGWHSARYGTREPSWTRRITTRGQDTTFVTALGCDVKLEPGAVIIDGERISLEE